MAIILGEVEKQYAGSAEAARDADGGVQGLANSYSDLQEAIGRILQPQSEANEGLSKLIDLIIPAVDAVGDYNTALTKTKETNNEWLDSVVAVNDYLSFIGGGQIVKIADAVGQWVFNNEELTETLEEVKNGTEEVTQATEAQTEAVVELSKEEQKRLEKVEDIRRDALRDLIDIQEQFEEDSLEAQADYAEDRESAIKQSEDRITSLKARAAKEQLKADKKLAKDLLKVDTDLNKSLQRLRQDTDKKVQRIEQDARRDARKASQTRQTDGLQDERLFQFELRQLAAEGEGNAIAAALERREIEKQIASEKRQETQQDEQEDARIQIQRLREDADIRAQRLREDAQQRKDIIREEAALERETRSEELKIAIAEENKALKERLAELEKFNTERLADIEETKKESIAKTAAELTTIKDITRTELRELSKQAGELGDDVGAQFAMGLNDGFNRENRIDDILNDLGISSLRGRGGGGFGGNRRGSGNPSSMMMFQHGGEFRVGGSGGPDSQLVNFLASPGETVTVSPPGQGAAPVFNITATGDGGEQLAQIMREKINEGLQEYTDTVIVPVLQ